MCEKPNHTTSPQLLPKIDIVPKKERFGLSEKRVPT